MLICVFMVIESPSSLVVNWPVSASMSNEAASGSLASRSESQIISIIICSTQHIADVHAFTAVFSATVRSVRSPSPSLRLKYGALFTTAALSAVSSVSLIMTLIVSAERVRSPLAPSETVTITS